MLTLLWTILGLWVAWKCFRSLTLEYRQARELERWRLEADQAENEHLWQQVDEAVNQDGDQ